MTKKKREPQQPTIATVIDGIGYTAPLTNADWGRVFAEELLATGDGDAILYALADAGESYRSRYLSQTRAAARKAAENMIRQGDNSDYESLVQMQLDFELTIPGQPPIAIGLATHLLIKLAYAHHSKLLAGQIENNDFLARAMQATQAYPDRRLVELVASGEVDVSALTFSKDAVA